MLDSACVEGKVRMKSRASWGAPALRVLAISALSVFTLDRTSAQAPTSQAAPPTTTIKVTTRLVTVDVVAHDKKNQPVHGLTKDDFELLDDGKPQTVSVFSVEGQAATVPERAPLASLPPGTFTNRPTRPSAVAGSITVILLDGLNTSVNDLAMARGQIEKLIPQLQSRDRVGLYSLESRVRIVQEITNDPSLLLQALKGVHAKLASSQLAGHAELPRAHDDTLPRLSDGTALRIQQSGDLTFGALEAIAQHLADVPGRKTLIWISHGLPLTFRTPNPQAINTVGRNIPPPPTDETNFTPQIQKTSRVLSNYGVALYPIDARGLSALSGGAWRAQGAGLLLADLTGGRPFYNDNDISAAIRSAIDDSKLTYVLGFYPAADRWDSKFHLIKVRVNQPGVKLLYRSGYLAAPEEQNPSPADSQSALGKAVLSPLDCTAIGLRAQLQKAHPFDIDLRVDVNDLLLSHNNDRWDGDLEIVIAQRTAAGSMVGRSGHKHSVKLNLKEDYYAQLKAEGLQLFFPVDPDRKAVELRVVVRDSNSGALGSVSVPLRKM